MIKQDLYQVHVGHVNLRCSKRIMNKDGDDEYFTGKWSKYGSDIINSVGCVDCHNPETMELQVNRKYLNDGFKS